MQCHLIATMHNASIVYEDVHTPISVLQKVAQSLYAAALGYIKWIKNWLHLTLPCQEGNCGVTSTLIPC